MRTNNLNFALNSFKNINMLKLYLSDRNNSIYYSVFAIMNVIILIELLFLCSIMFNKSLINLRLN